MSDDRVAQRLRTEAVDALLAIGAGAAADRIADDLVARYQEPQRHYHTLEHLSEMLAELDDAASVVLVAAWYHDAIYEPASATNEADSAALARRMLTDAGVAPELVARVAELVLLTATHAPPDGDPDAAGFLDADLAILASEPARYNRYARDVRAEFAHVPEELWRSGRGAVLADFVERDRLFLTDDAHRRLDVAARTNLRRELAALHALERVHGDG